jgi:hypothetical protein
MSRGARRGFQTDIDHKFVMPASAPSGNEPTSKKFFVSFFQKRNTSFFTFTQ